MNSEIKDKWVNALRSGEYSQTTNSLKTDKGFCCLGVLCDLYLKDNNLEWDKYESNNYYYYSCIGEKGVLPMDVMRWAGLKEPSPEVRVIMDNNRIANKIALSELNDAKETFDTIAYLIETQF